MVLIDLLSCSELDLINYNPPRPKKLRVWLPKICIFRPKPDPSLEKPVLACNKFIGLGIFFFGVKARLSPNFDHLYTESCLQNSDIFFLFFCNCRCGLLRQSMMNLGHQSCIGSASNFTIKSKMNVGVRNHGRLFGLRVYLAPTDFDWRAKLVRKFLVYIICNSLVFIVEQRS